MGMYIEIDLKNRHYVNGDDEDDEYNYWELDTDEDDSVFTQTIRMLIKDESLTQTILPEAYYDCDWDTLIYKVSKNDR